MEYLNQKSSLVLVAFSLALGLGSQACFADAIAYDHSPNHPGNQHDPGHGNNPGHNHDPGDNHHPGHDHDPGHGPVYGGPGYGGPGYGYGSGTGTGTGTGCQQGFQIGICVGEALARDGITLPPSGGTLDDATTSALQAAIESCQAE